MHITSLEIVAFSVLSSGTNWHNIERSMELEILKKS